MDKLILKISKSYFVKQISDTEISVIASYKANLNAVAEEHNLFLIHTIEQQFSVQGIFKIK